MLIRVLGSAAGGGFPQWNCGCPNCAGVRTGSIRALARTQESVAVSADGESWFLLNASPEVRQQIESFDKLHPRAQRDTPIQGIVLTNGDLDHCLGLLSLRESQPLALYATPRVRSGFTEGNVLYRTLQRFDGQVVWHALELGEPGPELPLLVHGGAPSGLTLRAFAAPGKAALHLDQSKPEPGDNIGLLIKDLRSQKTLAYVPAAGATSRAVSQALNAADVVFFDGTFWSSDELIKLGASERRAEDMAHWPIGGAEGSLRFLSQLPALRRVLIHINNTNPMLREDSAERAEVHAAGVEVAHDGMELAL
ncbi:MAG TPA: pyrroloquinoline quinone biosynthesis protein PqqB [Polyangiaceae bacterium]|nr:pyrroloquinoline quinone biosynthesis protein PqqB [Polyangiaceae bacterium]